MVQRQPLLLPDIQRPVVERGGDAGDRGELGRAPGSCRRARTATGCWTTAAPAPAARRRRRRRWRTSPPSPPRASTFASSSAFAAGATSTTSSTPSRSRPADDRGDVLASCSRSPRAHRRPGRAPPWPGELTVVKTWAPAQRASWIAALPTAPAPPATSTDRPASAPGASSVGEPVGQRSGRGGRSWRGCRGSLPRRSTPSPAAGPPAPRAARRTPARSPRAAARRPATARRADRGRARAPDRPRRRRRRRPGWAPPAGTSAARRGRRPPATSSRWG